MSLEHYPTGEKLATDTESQLAWLVREMGYSRDKTKGYEEKLVRLDRDPSDVQSVFGFMSGYWHRFLQADGIRQQIPEQIAVDRALQAQAKVVAGVADKIAFALWLQGMATNKTIEPETLLDTALVSLRKRVASTKDAYSSQELMHFNSVTFQDNPLGQSILGLHATFTRDPHDTESLHEIALVGAATGVLMWQTYAETLQQQGYSVVMPKPGLSSGNIEPWE